MDRHQMLDRIMAATGRWDMVVIGGGATGAGIAVDAASRGYSVVLLEQNDFGQGTSSRSTKLVHGGVRYLQQGDIALVIEALRERGIMRRNAPHLVFDAPFVVPNYHWWEAPFYGTGLKLYDLLAGRHGFGRSRLLTRRELLRRIPTLEPAGLRGGVLYHDGQFDDARLLINLIQTAIERGACAVNYCRVEAVAHDEAGRACGVEAIDTESGRQLSVRARCVINATGAFCDSVRRMDQPDAPALIAPSQGLHIVLDRSFLPGDTAIMVPRTRDGRVMFAIPWQGHTLVGTTDNPIDEAVLEPAPLEGEIDYILQTAAPYLSRDPAPADILSVFAGIRPLVKAGDAAATAALSRDHTIHISPSGMLTIAGGKWTTYRRMAQDCIDRAASIAALPSRPCITQMLPIHGHLPHDDRHDELSGYGADAPLLRRLMQQRPELTRRLHPDLPVRAVQVVWAARREMARTVEDVLSRRTRVLPLNARAAAQMAPAAAALLAGELNRDATWQYRQVSVFQALARRYLPQ